MPGVRLQRRLDFIIVMLRVIKWEKPILNQPLKHLNLSFLYSLVSFFLSFFVLVLSVKISTYNNVVT